jgi:hypothetical protein
VPSGSLVPSGRSLPGPRFQALAHEDLDHPAHHERIDAPIRRGRVPEVMTDSGDVDGTVADDSSQPLIGLLVVDVSEWIAPSNCGVLFAKESVTFNTSGFPTPTTLVTHRWAAPPVGAARRRPVQPWRIR